MTQIVCFATKGAGSNEETRIRTLLEPLSPSVWPFDASRKVRSALLLLRELRVRRPPLAVMEGTGLGGGLALLLARALYGVRYVVSTGDAVAPFIASRNPVLRPAAALYERVLYARSSGFIGWTPYLAGRALDMGARRVMTAANWALHPDATREAAEMRRHLGIAQDALVFGLIGSLEWNRRVRYCYGLELVKAAARVDRQNLVVLIAGDGDGRAQLEDLAGDRLGRNILLPGAIPHEDVPAYLTVIDVGSLPQSVDKVGAFRYTTKLSEYVAAGLPVVTGEIPLSYDLDDGWLWRLPGDAPWDDTYVAALAELMSTVTAEAIQERRSRVVNLPIFDRARQQRQVTAFVSDLLRAVASGDTLSQTKT